MNKKEVLTLIWSLSQSQGFYGRLYEAIMGAEEDAKEEFFNQFSECKTTLDVVLMIET